MLSSISNAASLSRVSYRFETAQANTASKEGAAKTCSLLSPCGYSFIARYQHASGGRDGHQKAEEVFGSRCCQFIPATLVRGTSDLGSLALTSVSDV